MSKRAVILCMYADNDITSDLGWDGIEMFMVYDVLDDMWVFADMEEARCKDWADLRNYTIIPKEEIFRLTNQGWELVE